MTELTKAEIARWNRVIDTRVFHGNSAVRRHYDIPPKLESMMADAPSSVHPLTHKFLGKEMYLVITRPVRSPEIEKRLNEHLAHQVELERKGIMFAAGPLYSERIADPGGRHVRAARQFIRGGGGDRRHRSRCTPRGCAPTRSRNGA